MKIYRDELFGPVPGRRPSQNFDRPADDQRARIRQQHSIFTRDGDTLET